MREKELRIALVCFGGVSLAVYMHGIAKEILKLVRASAALHAIKDRTRRRTASFFDSHDPDDPEYDSEAIYFELLRDIGRKIELRAVVDIVAGASAGGINGTMLARALGHDLRFGPLRELWLDNADVNVLLAPDARPGAVSKLFLVPFIWGASKIGLIPSENREVRRNMSMFLRSRWFQPPLSGAVMDALMYDAAVSLGEPASPLSSLIPTGQSLDLFVTLTDYHGYSQAVPIHDPPIIHEVDHHHLLHFTYRRDVSGAVRSDFARANIAALAFAARATASFPGAFPPARIVDIDALVKARGDAWPTREDFIARNFVGHRQAGVDPTVASFIDGSVLNNRPFREAITAIQGRPAYRQVDRRLIYIDPDPLSLAGSNKNDIPGFFSTLFGAMSDIPRTQPVTDELGYVATYNEQVSRIRAIITASRGRVSDLVAATIAEPLDKPVSAQELGRWRERANATAVHDAGFAYEGYVRLKLTTVRDFIVSLIVRLRDAGENSPQQRAVAAILAEWMACRGVVYSNGAGEPPPEEKGEAALPRWAEFLVVFDVKYRERRLHFLIEDLNRLYAMLDDAAYASLEPRAIDALKRSFYAMLDDLARRQDVPAFTPQTRDLVRAVFAAEPSSDDLRHVADYARRFVAEQGEAIDRLMDRLAAEINLDGTTHALDALLAGLDRAVWHDAAVRELVVHYLGFPFWDVLTFPLMSTRESGEINQILVDRISPQDVHALKGFAGSASLKGAEFGHFAAFLSRGYRENDYLLGRLHALERLIDILCDSAGVEPKDRLDAAAVKKRGFLRIIAAEEKHLVASDKLVAALKRRIAQL